jgi:hypothetical protein
VKHTQKLPRLPSTARVVAFCREERCVERRSNAVPLLIWTHYLSFEATGALPVCQANDPDALYMRLAPMLFKPAVLS